MLGRDQAGAEGTVQALRKHGLHARGGGPGGQSTQHGPGALEAWPACQGGIVYILYICVCVMPLGRGLRRLEG